MHGWYHRGEAAKSGVTIGNILDRIFNLETAVKVLPQKNAKITKTKTHGKSVFFAVFAFLGGKTVSPNR